MRLGHESASRIGKTIPLVQLIDLKKCKLSGVCETFDKCKFQRHNRPERPEESKNATKVLDLVHGDVQGPIKNLCASGARYLISLLDDSSGPSMLILLRYTDESREALKEMISQMENNTGHSVKRLRSDRASELLSRSIQSWLREKVFAHEASPDYSPESNVKAE